MQTDDLIWEIINQQMGYLTAGNKKLVHNCHFCKKFNVAGRCTRKFCPLANAKYATVLEEDGILYLYMKTPERAHMPAKLWEKVKLSKNYPQALKQLNENLEFWPGHLVKKCKQRLTRLTQSLIRSRKLAKKEDRVLITVNKKRTRQDLKRSMKAEIAANLEVKIKQELLERLKKGTYPHFGREYEKLLHPEKEAEQEVEQEQEAYEKIPDVQYVASGFDSDNDNDMFSSDDESRAPKRARKSKGVEREYEVEDKDTEKQY